MLIIAPHPDDECIGVGGLMLQYPQQCDVLVLSDGSQGRSLGCTREEIIKIREREIAAEMESVGIKAYKLLGLEDGALFEETACMKGEDLSIYTKIFVPYKEDKHPDHRAAFWALMEGLKTQNINSVEVYQYEVSTRIPIATHGVILGDKMADKLKLIDFHSSQTAQYDYCKMATENNLYRAAQFSEKYVEAYMFTNVSIEREMKHDFALERLQQKQRHFLKVYDMWLAILVENRDIAQFFKASGYQKVAIYGYAALGRRLKEHLQSLDGVHVEYIIDRRAAHKKVSDIVIVEPSNVMKAVDVIIVTAVHDYNQIKRDLKDLGYVSVISLEDMLDNINRNC